MVNKNSSILYHEWVLAYEDELTLSEFGQLYIAIVHYGQYGEEPEFEDRLLRSIWKKMKEALDENSEKWEKRCEANRENGKKGGRPKKTEENPLGFDGLENKPNETDCLENAENKTQKTMTNDLMTNDYMTNDIPPYNPPTGGNPPVCDIVSYLNEKTGKAYKSSSRKTQDLIKARLKEGFTVDDFKTVIDKKASAWLNDPKMNQYLRPETLFGTKFESYLNEQKKFAPKTEFNNFAQRGYDWKSLEGELLAK